MNMLLYIQTLAVILFVGFIGLGDALAQTPPPPPLPAVSNQTYRCV
jgi:hypothetical protein